MKLYSVVYADPPWRYDFSISDSQKVENHYETMELEDIKCLKVPSAENSVLFLWVTSPKLKEGLEVMQAWGFTYKSSLVWDKTVIGMGYWFRSQHEFLLVGTKGKFSPPKPIERVSSVFREKKTEHSKKPDVIRLWISQWYPDCKKLELFAREKFEEWDVMGNQIPATTQVRLKS